MNTSPNPYEASATEPETDETATDENSRRRALAISMWVCGVTAIAMLPVYPWQPELWADRPLPDGVHYAWIAPFCCSVASVLTGCGLFTLSRRADQLGALIGILVVGWWPGWLAISWWRYFAMH